MYNKKTITIFGKVDFQSLLDKMRSWINKHWGNNNYVERCINSSSYTFIHAYSNRDNMSTIDIIQTGCAIFISSVLNICLFLENLIDDEFTYEQRILIIRHKHVFVHSNNDKLYIVFVV